TGKKWGLLRDRTRAPDRTRREDSAGECSQLVAPGLALQVATLLIPGAQHDALDGLAFHQRIVYGRPMRVAVNDAADARGFEGGCHGCRVDIHDLRDGP